MASSCCEWDIPTREEAAGSAPDRPGQGSGHRHGNCWQRVSPHYCLYAPHDDDSEIRAPKPRVHSEARPPWGTKTTRLQLGSGKQQLDILQEFIYLLLVKTEPTVHSVKLIWRWSWSYLWWLFQPLHDNRHLHWAGSLPVVAAIHGAFTPHVYM